MPPKRELFQTQLVVNMFKGVEDNPLENILLQKLESALEQSSGNYSSQKSQHHDHFQHVLSEMTRDLSEKRQMEILRPEIMHLLHGLNLLELIEFDAKLAKK